MADNWIKITEKNKEYVTNHLARINGLGIEFSSHLKADAAANLLLVAYEHIGAMFLEHHDKTCQDCPAVRFIANTLIAINQVRDDQLKEMGVVDDQRVQKYD